jgi:hypothetical protein
MKAATILGAIIGLLLIGGIVFVEVYYTLSQQPDTYIGKILFTDDNAYKNFKVALLDEQVTIRSLNSLSSDGHFIDFTVTSPRENNFPYGHKVPHDDFVTALSAGFSSGLMGSFVGGMIGWALTFRPS